MRKYIFSTLPLLYFLLTNTIYAEHNSFNFYHEIAQKQTITKDDLIALENSLDKIRKSNEQTLSKQSLIALLKPLLSLDATKTEEPFILLTIQKNMISLVLKQFLKTKDKKAQQELSLILIRYLKHLNSRLIKNYKDAPVTANVSLPQDVRPPANGFFVSGMDPDFIKDPEVQMHYRAAIKENRDSIFQNSYQSGIRSVIPDIERALKDLGEH